MFFMLQVSLLWTEKKLKSSTHNITGASTRITTGASMTRPFKLLAFLNYPSVCHF